MTTTVIGPASRPRRLQGTERVAALLLAMGKPVAERLLPHFEPDEIRAISRTAAALGPVPPATLEALIEEFAGQFAVGLNLLGSAREIENLLTGVLSPEQIADIMSDPPAETAETIWEKVSDLPEAVLSDYLAGEHPQTAALVLARVRPDLAARVLAVMPPALRDEVTRRMLASRPAAEPALMILAATLQEDLLLDPARTAAADAHERVARIINKMSFETKEGVLRGLGAVRPESVDILKGMLFSFEDLPKLTPDTLTRLLDVIPPERLVTALNATPEDFRAIVLAALPARSRRAIETELAREDPVAERDVSEARRQIADTALEMSDRGEIRLDFDEDAAR